MGPEYGTHLMKLRGIGFQLQLALDKAKLGGPATMQMRGAWLIAEKAAQDLASLLDKYMPAQVLIRATGERLARKNRT